MMTDNIIIKAAKKSLFDLLTMTKGQFITLLLIFGWNCLRGFREDFASNLWLVFFASMFSDLLETNLCCLMDAPLEQKEFWKLMVISEWIKRYVLTLFLILPTLVKAYQTGEFSAVSSCFASILSIMFWVTAWINVKKSFKIPYLFALQIIALIGFLVLEAFAGEFNSPLWVLGLVIAVTLLYSFGKYFFIRKEEPYSFFEEVVKE